MKVNRKIIKIDEERCDGCGQCIIACAEGAMEIIDGKAKVISDNLCDGLGACLGECPQGALEVIEREADEFDEEAVEVRLAEQKTANTPKPAVVQCGCPSAGLQVFDKPGQDQTVAETTSVGVEKSALTHWPVQINLIPPTAPFLKGADLLVMADCVPVAFPSLHKEFLNGKSVAIGCPKFDDAPEYIKKFTDIFNTADIKSITTVVMEVPCCAGLPIIVERGMQKSGKNVPMEQVVISTKGRILKRVKS